MDTFCQIFFKKGCERKKLVHVNSASAWSMVVVHMFRCISFFIFPVKSEVRKHAPHFGKVFKIGPSIIF